MYCYTRLMDAALRVQHQQVAHRPHVGTRWLMIGLGRLRSSSISATPKYIGVYHEASSKQRKFPCNIRLPLPSAVLPTTMQRITLPTTNVG